MRLGRLLPLKCRGHAKFIFAYRFIHANHAEKERQIEQERSGKFENIFQSRQ